MKIIGYVLGEEGYEMPLCLPCSKGYRKESKELGSHLILEGDWGSYLCEICEEEIK